MNAPIAGVVGFVVGLITSVLLGAFDPNEAQCEWRPIGDWAVSTITQEAGTETVEFMTLAGVWCDGKKVEVEPL